MSCFYFEAYKEATTTILPSGLTSSKIGPSGKRTTSTGVRVLLGATAAEKTAPLLKYCVENIVKIRNRPIKNFSSQITMGMMSENTISVEILNCQGELYGELDTEEVKAKQDQNINQAFEDAELGQEIKAFKHPSTTRLDS
ncbi:hypothetical protein PSTT_00667, partial [Puccinia striiformis]